MLFVIKKIIKLIAILIRNTRIIIGIVLKISLNYTSPILRKQNDGNTVKKFQLVWILKVTLYDFLLYSIRINIPLEELY